jgi:hypothetical protein
LWGGQFWRQPAFSRLVADPIPNNDLPFNRR